MREWGGKHPFLRTNHKEVQMPRVLSKAETNLKKLAKSPIPMNFVKKNEGAWDHEKWLAFLEYLKGKNYFPIDTDRVGLLLEEKKAKYLQMQANAEK